MAINPRRASEVIIEFYFNETVSKEDRTYLENEAKKCPVALSLHPDMLQNITFKYD